MGRRRNRNEDQPERRRPEMPSAPTSVPISPSWMPITIGPGVWLVLLLFAAALLRFYVLAYRDLWFDELGSVALATRGDLWTSEGGNPPLFFALLKIWIAVTGVDIASVRALSALAGVGSVAAVFWVASELNLLPAVRWWGAILLALSPLQLYYSQETRAYALLVLLVLVAMGTMMRALTTGRPVWWTAHGLSVLAGLYTHNMMIPMVAALWVAAVMLRAPRRRLLELIVAHGLALLAYAPWTPRLWQQSGGESHDWIADVIGHLNAAGLVVSTIESFSLGGRLPDHVPFPAILGVAPWALLASGSALVMAMLAGYRAWRQPPGDLARSSLAVLVLFSLWPIGFLLAYSWLNKPLYVFGRYDLPAQPAFLLLIAIGLVEATAKLRVIGRAGSMLPVLVVLILASCALYPKLALGNGVAPHASTELASALRTWAGPTDLVIALDYSEPFASYAVARSGTSVAVQAFPAQPMHQLDRASFNARLGTHRSVFQREASSLAAVVQGRRIWLVHSPIYDDCETTPTGYEVFRRLLMSELRNHTVRDDVVGIALRQKNVVLLEPRLAAQIRR